MDKRIILFFFFIFYVVCDYGDSCENNFQCDGFLCKNGTCLDCVDYKSCPEKNDNCFNQTILYNGSYIDVKQCLPKKLFFPITPWEILATVLCVVGGVICASAGMGGSQLYIPLLLVAAGYGAKLTIPRSTALTVGVYFINFSNEFFYKLKGKKKPVIDYELVMTIMPIMLCGTMVGVMLNKMCPDWFIVGLLVCVLSFGSFRSLLKTIRMVIKENKEIKAEKEAKKRAENGEGNAYTTIEEETEADDEEKNDDKGEQTEEKKENIKYDKVEQVSISLSDEKGEIKHLVTEKDPILSINKKTTEEDDDDEKEIKAKNWMMKIILIYEQCQLQPIQKLMLIGEWALVFLLTLIKGTSAMPSILGIENCSWVFWIVYMIPFPILLFVTFFSGFLLHLIYKGKQNTKNYKFIEGEMKWTLKRSLFVPLLFAGTGILCGLLGIGGGVVNSILMLEIGLSPDITVASLSLMGLCTASSTLSQYFIEGLISIDYLIWFFSFGAGASFVGRVLIGALLRKMKRKSIMVLTISFVVVLSTFLLAGIGIKDVIVDIVKKDWNSFFFQGPC